MSYAGIYLHGLTQSEYVWLLLTVNLSAASRRKGICYFEVTLPEGLAHLSAKMTQLGLMPLAMTLMFQKPE